MLASKQERAFDDEVARAIRYEDVELKLVHNGNPATVAVTLAKFAMKSFKLQIPSGLPDLTICWREYVLETPTLRARNECGYAPASMHFCPGETAIANELQDAFLLLLAALYVMGELSKVLVVIRHPRDSRELRHVLRPLAPPKQ
ncbi:hypothetical protein LTR74_016755 [Friedmanniomyces endolithicus]|nr:hypothetical protein LTR74_016755 [Friedmanniomyces endolithicus]